jgi:hypothetical protein
MMLALFACGVLRVTVAVAYACAVLMRPDIAERLRLPFALLVLTVATYDAVMMWRRSRRQR